MAVSAIDEFLSDPGSRIAEVADDKASGSLWRRGGILWKERDLESISFLSAFTLVNLFIFHLLLTTSYYAQIEYELRGLFAWIYAIFSFALLIVGVWPIGAKAAGRLRDGVFSDELNIFLAFFLLGGYAVLGCFFDFEGLRTLRLGESFILVISIVAAKEWIERWVYDHIDSLSDISLSGSVAYARVIKGERKEGEVDRRIEIRKRPQEVEVGDVYRCGVGDVIPCDGKVLRGECELRERRLSGLEFIRFKGKGDEILAGSRVVRGEFEARATTPFKDSFATSMEEYFLDALNGIDDVDEKGEKISQSVNFCLIVFAIIGGQLFYTQGIPFRDIAAFASCVLLISCASSVCATGSVLLRLWIAKSFREGMVFKCFTAAENLRDIFSLIIDRSGGTLVLEERIRGFSLLDDRYEKEGVLKTCALIFSRSEDPFYLDGVSFCMDNLREPPEIVSVEGFKDYSDLGVCGIVSGVEFSVGSEEFLVQRGVQLQYSEVDQPLEGKRTLYVAVGEDVVAKFVVLTESRIGGKAPQEVLRRLGVRTLMLSADNKEVADREGKAAGLELCDIYGDLSDAEKVQKIRNCDRTIVLADRATEDSVLKAGSVSVAVFDELLWDIGRADVTFFKNSLSMVPVLLMTVKELNIIKKQNLAVGVTLGVLVLGLSFSGLVTPAIAAVSMAIASVFFLVNCIRLLESSDGSVVYDEGAGAFN